MTQKEPQLVTFGCRLNTYESEVMRAHAVKAGMKDAIIFNTCAVTAQAEKDARSAIRKARRENPGARIIVTGCSAQVNPKMYGDMVEVDLVIGNDLKLKEETWASTNSLSPILGGEGEGEGDVGSSSNFPLSLDPSPPLRRGEGKYGGEKILVNDIMAVKETAGHLVAGFEERSRAFLQVQNGCDHRCTFCIIPYGRGNSRSVPIGVIVEQTRALVAAGYKEIVFTGVDITSYGPDLPGKPKLGQMIRRVLALVPELPRLRLSSLDPAEIDDDLWKLIAEEPRFMPHLHVSLQAGDNMILKRMKRRHSREDAIAMCARAKSYRPDMAFGADIIAGFPTETDEMFENTMRIVDECELTFLHVFPYSEREGTPAARMPQVAKSVRKERAARLRKLGEQRMEKFLNENINKTMQVIAEKGNMGRAENFALVQLDQEVEAGDLFKVMTTGVKNNALSGYLLT